MLTMRYISLMLFAVISCKSASMGGSTGPAKPAAASPNAAGTSVIDNGIPPTPISSGTVPTPATQGTPPAAVSPVTPNSTPVPTSATPLTGLWDAVGYDCPGGAPQIEVISVSQNGTQFVGTKVTGDSCVPAGYISFQGSIVNGALSLNFNQAQPGAPVSLSPAVAPGTYTPTLIQILGNKVSGPNLKLTPHKT